MQRIANFLIARPFWFPAVAALALVLLPLAIWLDLTRLTDRALGLQAQRFNEMLADVRDYYTVNVEAAVLANAGRPMVVSHDHGSRAGAVPATATMAIELGEILGRRSELSQFRLVSDLPFASRGPLELSPFEQRALAHFRAQASPDPAYTEFSGSLFNRRVHFAGPLIMAQACVECHNAAPDSPKLDWKVGDVRGLQTVELEQPLAQSLFSFTYLLAYFVGAGLIGIAVSTLFWHRARDYRRLNSELEQANSFLSRVSDSIGRYLPEQIYRRIFLGERHAVISAERKMLTIFVSDLRDFTDIAEQLPPEALTRLLNEYFTEMSSIAAEHGATIDKFVGDAIVGFFGDPETRGAQEDAKACVRMALAMQRRMTELNPGWLEGGLPQRLEARIGIHTGFCSVGNFGSADRMNYTIIGAAANLAARLEHLAEPGGVVISPDTYALVASSVRARSMAPIRLKGFREVIVPRIVDEMPGAGDGSLVTERTGRTSAVQAQADAFTSA
jgi:adenylate cyclase